ncbi:amidohydrolase [Lacihabitans sp. LS3-19]|uniref:amidohydrolase n=1 Tax=Lacihabitans sp. LS3-19 TaxID=2487335 RepID=UPI0020CD2428|nr:amidohydrolase [Lacihabitans sp. LS3-19]MCP9769039.1 amidohydrolase [Lacihabitans sp. LS3-19]
MKKIFLTLFLLAIVSLIYYCFFFDFDHSNDTLYFGGEIITMQDSTELAEAVYVKNGKIIATGNKSELIKLTSNKTELHDLKGKTLMPGFFDPHGHFDFATIFADMVDISGINHRTPKEVWDKVEAACKKGQKGEWIFFYGMDPPLTKGIKSPTISYLDSIAPDKPIVIITKALHVFYVNSQAFAEIGISSKTPDPSKASYYERDEKGNLTGGIVEQAALEPLRLKLQEIVKKNFVKNTQKVLDDYAQMGVTSVVNMGLSNTSDLILSLYRHLSGEKPKPLTNALQLIGKLPNRQPNPRIFLYLRKEYDSFLPKNVENGDDFFKILGLKFWYDGSPYSGSMFLRKPYLQSNFTINDIHLGPGHTSESLMRQSELETLIEKYQSKGWQIAVHSQGDIAGEEVIAAYENVHKKSPINTYRHRIEHCMLLPKTSLEAMKKMNISPSFHINHLLFYGDFLKSDIIGEERSEQIFPIQSAVNHKLRYTLHADSPQFIPNPLSLISTSVNRTTESGTLIGPAERVSVWQALKSMTIDAAWQMHMEDKLGSIEKGKYADFVILDKNPLKVPSQNLSKIKVLETIVAGNQIWKAK